MFRLLRQCEYIRLSVDQYVCDHHGGYGIDYPPEKYPEYQSNDPDEPDKFLLRLLSWNTAQISEGEVRVRRPLAVVLDHYFAAKADRDVVKEIVEPEGARWVLVYFAISEDRQAIRERATGRKTKRAAALGSCDGGNVFEITNEVLDSYLATFEVKEKLQYTESRAVLWQKIPLSVYTRPEFYRGGPCRKFIRIGGAGAITKVF